MASAILCVEWKTMGIMTRHCRPYPHHDCMDRHALERLGHHVVSRRVALGYRNRTDPADSLQFTVRTLADIEHGVRRASPGTYAMLEQAFLGAGKHRHHPGGRGAPRTRGQAAQYRAPL
jgi:hypothetical protein